MPVFGELKLVNEHFSWVYQMRVVGKLTCVVLVRAQSICINERFSWAYQTRVFGEHWYAHTNIIGVNVAFWVS